MLKMVCLAMLYNANYTQILLGLKPSKRLLLGSIIIDVIKLLL